MPIILYLHDRPKAPVNPSVALLDLCTYLFAGIDRIMNHPQCKIYANKKKRLMSCIIIY